jgi:hypothetical protein
MTYAFFDSCGGPVESKHRGEAEEIIRIAGLNILLISVVWTVKVDRNEHFLCWTLIQNFFQYYLYKSHWKYKLYKIPLWSKLNVKTSSGRLKPHSCQTHQPTVRLLTPAKRRLRQTPPQPHLHFLLPESPPSELNFNYFRIARTSHSYSQAWRTMAIILGTYS